jgi:hypothetical protein
MLPVITRLTLKVTKSIIRDVVTKFDIRTNLKGKGARTSCHGIIKAAKVAAVAHGAKMEVGNPLKTSTH